MNDETCARPAGDSTCGWPIHDHGYLCDTETTHGRDHTGCRDLLARDLGDVAALAEELEVNLTRQARRGERSGGRSAEVPLPFDYRASEDTYVLRTCLSAWCRVVTEQRGEPVAGPVDDTPASMAALLLRNLPWIVRNPLAPEAYDEITYAVRVTRRVIDRAEDRSYAGTCGAETSGEACTDELWARPKAATVVCRTCGAEHDVAERRTWLLDAVEDRLAPASLIAAAVTRLGQPVTSERVRQWARRGRIVARGHEGDERPLYRVGDVLDLLAGEAARHAGKRGA